MVRFWIQEYPVIAWGTGEKVMIDCWFWRDENCEEDIGPFDYFEEATADYAKFRDIEGRG